MSKQLINQDKNSDKRAKRPQGQEAAKAYPAISSENIKKTGGGEGGKIYQSHSAISGRRNQG